MNLKLRIKPIDKTSNIHILGQMGEGFEYSILDCRRIGGISDELYIATINILIQLVNSHNIFSKATPIITKEVLQKLKNCLSENHPLFTELSTLLDTILKG